METDEKICWGCISKLLDKISEQADRIGWKELVDESILVFETVEKETDATKIFFDSYQFLFRLYYRVKGMNSPLPFNLFYKTTHLVDHTDKEFYSIRNYGYKTFVWARKNGFTEYLDNNIIDIPKDKLTKEQIKTFESKIKN